MLIRLWLTRARQYSFRGMQHARLHTEVRATKGIDLSLHRIKKLLARLSSPQSAFPVIHVAGTNSKGSTIAYLSSILNNAMGIKSASFVSPHLLTPQDCCKIGDKIIDSNIWLEADGRVRDADSFSGTLDDIKAAPLESSPFELLTAQCFTALNMLMPPDRPEILLVEVGMGGALDATNIFSPSQVLASVICPIDYDHQAFLGDTLGQIAKQKAGIIKQSGLCILADQRRLNPNELGNDEFDSTRMNLQKGQGEELEAYEVQETIRQVCLSIQARLVKAYVPWQALSSTAIIQNATVSPWSAQTITNSRFAPILAPSKLHKGVYVSSTGDPVVPGPSIRLPQTRAALSGCHLALQTLWSIARDETPCALGMAGSDEHEEIRLRIAYGLQDEPYARKILTHAVEQTRIPGRAQWLDLTLPAVKTFIGVQSEEQETHTLHVLVDGAHNASAASALRLYVQSCLQQRLQKEGGSLIPQITITWILAFSKGKAIEEILSNLFKDMINAKTSIETKMRGLQIGNQIQHRVACVPFSTPVEGMPWVTPIPAEEIQYALKAHFPYLLDLKPFSTLQDALQWARLKGDGKMISADGQTSVVVIAGSLYLVSDVYRLLSS